MPISPSHTDPFFGLRILQPNEDPSLPPKRILNYKDGTELVYIPPGPFLMGDDELDGKYRCCPRHEVYLDGYYMGVWPVTNKQYRRYMRETGNQAPWNSSAWERGQLNLDYLEHPVVCVSWEEAEAYAEWAALRLPSEAEWEKAAGGPEGFKYPWGNDWDANRCRHMGNRGAGTTAEVKEYQSGVSVYGCEQMCGNVFEWCEDWYAADAYGEVERRNPRGPKTSSVRGYRGAVRVNRGGSWQNYAEAALVSYREGGAPGDRSDCLGFRLARSFP